MRICFGFFGINRSLFATGAAIKQNLIDPFRNSGAEVKIAVHFNEIKEPYDNPRAEEHSATTTRAGLGYLDPDVVFFEEQKPSNVDNLLDIAEKYKYKDEPNAPLITRHNVLWQLYSLNRLNKIIKFAFERDRFDVFVVSRADITFCSPIDLQEVADKLHDYKLLTPDWHRWGGLNDRFAIMNPTVFDIYTQRIRYFKSFARRHGYIHSESLLDYTMKLHGIHSGFLSTVAVRVRPDGSIPAVDRRLMDAASALREPAEAV